MDAPDRRRAAARVEEDLPVEARLVDLPAGARSRGHNAAPLADGIAPELRTPQSRRRHAGLRRDVHVLLPPRRPLLRLYGHFRQSFPRRDAREDAALLFPDAATPRGAGGAQISGGPDL